MAGTRSALIIASDAYADPGLRRLRAPATDAGALAGVLQDPEIGGFEVRTLLNEPAHEISLAVEEFFADRRPDDLLLLHFSCHGVKDEAGELHFAAANTKLIRLGATAVAAAFVSRCMSRSRSRRVVLLLDCCYAGAFERGMTARAGTTMSVEEHFGGRGRAVITASSAMEYAFEGDELADSNQPTPSVFTSALVQGLRTGDADRDQDGLVSLDELYDYVYDRVRTTTSNQTPSKWVYGVQGDLYIARRSRPVATPAPLPAALHDAILSPLAGVRAAAVPELARVAQSRHAGQALAARMALERLVDDDSRTVSTTAASAMGALPAGGPQIPSAPAHPVHGPPGLATEDPRAPEDVSVEPTQPVVPADRSLRSAGRLAIIGGVLLLLSLLLPYREDVLGFRQPVVPPYVLMLAMAACGAGVATLLPRTRQVIGPGILLGIVAASTAELADLVSSWDEQAGLRIGFGVALAGRGFLVASACVAGLALFRRGDVRLVRRPPSDMIWWVVAILGVTSAVVLAVHTNRLLGDDPAWSIAPYAWIALLALLLPLWSAAARPRLLAASVLLGWAVGGVTLSLLVHAALQWRRDTQGTGVGDVLIVVFGLTMLALSGLAAVLIRASATRSRG